MSRRFTTRWVPLREAAAFVAKHHRHHVPAQGGIVALGLWEGDDLVGVGVLGRPVSRMLQQAGVAEITRLCVREDIARIPRADGHDASGAASALDARLRRVAQALGFSRLVTYTLPEEGGMSLRGDGRQQDEMLSPGGEWSSPSRPRDKANHPTGRKVRWWASLKSQREIPL